MVLNLLWNWLLDGRMRVDMRCSIAQIRCPLSHAGHARRHLGVRHAQSGRHTQYGAGFVGVACIHLMRIRGQVMRG